MHSSSDQAEPNMTPILDMVFQLITFFMLVVNFKAADVNREVALPVIGSAAPSDEPDKRELLVLNILQDGTINVRGKNQPNTEAFLSIEARFLRSMHRPKEGESLPVTVVIRADRQIAFRSLMKVIDACKANGFDKFDFIVLRKAKGT